MSDKPESNDKSARSSWTGKAALAGAAIGSAALAAALLYASRRKERLESREKAKALRSSDDQAETD